jgi:hypothetical protein
LTWAAAICLQPFTGRFVCIGVVIENAQDLSEAGGGGLGFVIGAACIDWLPPFELPAESLHDTSHTSDQYRIARDRVRLNCPYEQKEGKWRIAR